MISENDHWQDNFILVQKSSRCAGSAHLRLWRVSFAESLEILRRGPSAEGVVRPVMVESVSEGVDEGL